MSDFQQKVEEAVRDVSTASVIKERMFTYVGFHQENRSVPDAGWKLHVSAAVSTAAEILERCLPILVDNRVNFKVVSTVSSLGMLNAIVADRSQVGKFVTVYPSDDGQAVRVAQLLHEATDGLEGPHIPSDRPLKPGSRVYYRYGEFRANYRQTKDGTVTAVLEGPDEQWVEEKRNPWFSPPPWVEDPLVAAGVAELPEKRYHGPIGQRYKILKAVKQASRGGVYFAEDHGVTPPVRCLIKEARAFVGQFLETGDDIRDIARREYKLLQELSDLPWIPKAWDMFLQEGNIYVVREIVPGESLGSFITKRSKKSVAELWPLVCKLAELLVDFHGRHLVINDIAPGNFIVTPSGMPRIIDVELIHRVGEPYHPRYRLYTKGYASPQREPGQEVPTFADDIFAFGRLVFFMLTGLSPQFGSSDASAVHHLIRLLRRLRPETPEPVLNFISKCIQYEPSERYVSAVEVHRACHELLQQPSSAEAPSFDSRVGPDQFPALTRDFREIAQRAGESAISDPRLSDEGYALRRLPTGGASPLSLHHGSPGIAMYIRDLYVVTGDERFLAAVERVAEQSYRNALATKLRVCPGLHMGYTGPAWLNLHVASLTGDERLIKRADEVMKTVTDEEIAACDITHGAAGLGFIYLELFRLTRDMGYLNKARSLGHEILSRATQGKVRHVWAYLSGDQPYGFAHGVAGIGYYLLELARLSGDQVFLEAAHDAAQELIENATTEPNTGGLIWPMKYGEEGNTWPYTWCNGSYGIGRFLLQAYQTFGEATYIQQARGAAVTLTQGHSSAHLRPLHQCCGIAGGIEFLLDLHSVTRDASYIEEAYWYGELLFLRSYRRESHVEWPSNSVSALPFSFMTGAVGVASALLRLSAHESFTRTWAMPVSGLTTVGDAANNTSIVQNAARIAH